MAASDLFRPPEAAASAVLRYLTAARWFAGKGRHATLSDLIRLPWVTSEDSWPAVRFEIAEISYPEAEGAPYELYSLPIAYWPEPQPGQVAAEIGWLADPDRGLLVGYDVAYDPAACRVLLDHLLRQRRFAAGDSEVRFHAPAPGPLSAGLEPRAFSGQQSNTSVMLGEAAMLKLFRRLELGRNLDIEVHDALSRSGLADVARLYGWIGASWVHHGQPALADLAMVVEKLPEATDGWGLALGSLREGHSFATHAAALGTALAETHEGLRRAFPTGRQAGADVAKVMTARLAAAREHAPQLATYAPALERLFAGLIGHDLPTQRVHGDFHLGQTLHTPRGWKIIDFEGEPAKSLAERAAPDSMWRDLAGMLRSFAYAAASAVGSHGPEGELASPAGDAAWVADCREAFLTAYAGGPRTAEDAVVLAAYEADKAIYDYEVVYEVRNRPDWVDIPLAAIAGLVDPATARDPEQRATPIGTAKE